MKIYLIPALSMLLALGSCARPPASAYEAASQTNAQGPAVSAIDLGKNSAGESCTAQRRADGAAVYCGSWDQPSANVLVGPAAQPGQLPSLATASPWRAALEAQYACGAPSAATILGNDPAQILSCTQRIGGWPHVALVSLIGGRIYYADGVLPALPAMQRAVGVVSGVLPAQSASSASVAGADQLLATRLAAEAFSSGDIGHYEALMQLGSTANQAEDFPASATAYRAALALQQKSLGAANPNTAAPMTDLALQLSDEGRYDQADTLFAQAALLAPYAADPTAEAQLLHDRALDALNQGQDQKALQLLGQAHDAYAALVPAQLLQARPAADANPVLAQLTQSSAGGGGQDQSTLTSPVTQQALLGVLETLRYKSIVLAQLGDKAGSVAAIREANEIAASNGIASPILDARLNRTSASIDERIGDAGGAAAQLAAAQSDFEAALPGSRPVAETQLLRAGALARQGDGAAALSACRSGIGLLRQLRLGTSARLIEPCLDVEYKAALADPASAQADYTAMFEMAELAQGSVTSQEIAQASARLSANAKDPKVASAIRARQDAAAHLAALYRKRDELQQGGPGVKPTTPAELAAFDQKIAAANTNLQQADLAVQAAAPNFGQLVQQVVPARAVLNLLHPHEAFLGITLTSDHAWLFLLQNQRLQVARSDVGTPGMTKLVNAVRASIEPTQAGLPPFAMQDASAIYQATIAPFAASLTHTSSLVVAPSGPLLSLPFALLPTGPAKPDDLADAPWLVRTKTLAYVPAAANFVSLRKIAGDSRATKPWFGFGDFHAVSLAQAKATFDGPSCGESASLFAGLPKLPFAKLELAAAAGIFGAGPQDELTGAAFTVPAVEAADLKDFRILHFATHALLPSDLPCASEPAIVTSAPAGAKSANRAMLTSSDVTNLHLDADLILLSACNTGGSDGRAGGEALTGLARSFFYAGARGLMVTQWSVNDQVSAYLVASTLQDLKSGEDGGSASSLRAAQLALINGAGHGMPANLANPFFWAAFVVIGDGGKIAGSSLADAQARQGVSDSGKAGL